MTDHPHPDDWDGTDLVFGSMAELREWYGQRASPTGQNSGTITIELPPADATGPAAPAYDALRRCKRLRRRRK